MARRPNLGFFGSKPGREVDWDDIGFDWSDFAQYSQECDCLVMLSQFEIELLLSLLRKNLSQSLDRWNDIRLYFSNEAVSVRDVVECLEVKLAMCDLNSSLVKSNLLLVAAITGTQIDLDEPEKYLKGVADYRMEGLANRIGPEELHTGLNTMQATIDRLQKKIAELEDDLAKVWSSLDDQTTVLGGTVTTPPPDPV